MRMEIVPGRTRVKVIDVPSNTLARSPNNCRRVTGETATVDTVS